MCFLCLQALIHFEAIQSTAKRIDYLDSLVEKVIMPNTENPTVVSASMREELSSIFLEVQIKFIMFAGGKLLRVDRVDCKLDMKDVLGHQYSRNCSLFLLTLH